MRGMSCRIAFEFPDFMIDAVIFLIFGRVSTVHLLLEAGWLGQCKKAWPMLLWSLGVPLPCGAVRSCKKCGVCGGCGLIVELSSYSKGSSCLTSCQNRGVFLRFGG